MKRNKAQTIKMFVVKKYILAHSAHEALKKERRVRPDDIWVDEDWRKENKYDLPSQIGFEIEHDYKFYDEWAHNKPK